VCLLIIASPNLRTTNCPEKLPFAKNISKTVQDSLIVSINFKQEVVCALSNGYVADDLGWPITTLNHLSFHILRCLMHLRNWWSQRLQIWCTGWMCLVGSWDPLKFPGSNHVTRTAGPKIIIFCTQVGYTYFSNRMTYHSQKGRSCGHVTVVKFCCLPWCRASRGFVSDSWATCYSCDAMLARVLAVNRCLSICLSVCLSVCPPVTSRWWATPHCPWN